MSKKIQPGLFEPALIREALGHSFKKLDPRTLVKNPVMFTVEIGTVVMLAVILYIAFTGDTAQGNLWYNVLLFIVLFITLLFPNFAESLAEARRKAQAKARATGGGDNDNAGLQGKPHEDE